MFTKDQIDQWILLGLSGDNYSDKHIFANSVNLTGIKRDMLEMKVQIGRWQLITSDFIFNSSAKDFVRKSLSLSNNFEKSDDDIIWGSKIHYSDLLPPHMVLALDLIHTPISNRHVALFKFDLNHIKRLENLKVYW